MPAAYTLRDGGDAKNKKQSMADLKLRRLNELNLRLKEDLDRPRIKVAEASMSYVEFTTSLVFCALANCLLQPHQLLQFDPRLHGTVCLGPNRKKGGSIHATTG
jgi:GGL domain